MPFQSEKQRRYLWANEPEIARDWTDTYGSGIAKALGGRIKQFYEMQGGVKNYLGKQKMVKAPTKWQSGPDKPSTELAYITEAEKDLLVKKDLHNSLKDGPNLNVDWPPNKRSIRAVQLGRQHQQAGCHRHNPVMSLSVVRVARMTCLLSLVVLASAFARRAAQQREQRQQQLQSSGIQA